VPTDPATTLQLTPNSIAVTPVAGSLQSGLLWARRRGNHSNQYFAATSVDAATIVETTRLANTEAVIFGTSVSGRDPKNDWRKTVKSRPRWLRAGVQEPKRNWRGWQREGRAELKMRKMVEKISRSVGGWRRTTHGRRGRATATTAATTMKARIVRCVEMDLMRATAIGVVVSSLEYNFCNLPSVIFSSAMMKGWGGDAAWVQWQRPSGAKPADADDASEHEQADDDKEEERSDESEDEDAEVKEEEEEEEEGEGADEEVGTSRKRRRRKPPVRCQSAFDYRSWLSWTVDHFHGYCRTEGGMSECCRWRQRNGGWRRINEWALTIRECVTFPSTFDS
jgi:hypothetical protein